MKVSNKKVQKRRGFLRINFQGQLLNAFKNKILKAIQIIIDIKSYYYF